MRRYGAAKEVWRKKMDEDEKRKLYNIVDREKLTRREANYKFVTDDEASFALGLPSLLRNEFLKYPKGRRYSEEDWAFRDAVKEMGMEAGVKLDVVKTGWVQGWLVTDGKKVVGITLSQRTKRSYEYTKRKLIKDEVAKIGVEMIDCFGDLVKLEEDLVKAFKN